MNKDWLSKYRVPTPSRDPALAERQPANVVETFGRELKQPDSGQPRLDPRVGAVNKDWLSKYRVPTPSVKMPAPRQEIKKAGILTAISQGRVPGVSDVASSAGRGLTAATELPGVQQIFRGLRATQQASVFGPLRATTAALKKGRLPSFPGLLRSSASALREDWGGQKALEGTRFEDNAFAGIALELAADPLWFLAPAKLARMARLPQLMRSATVQKGLSPLRKLGGTKPVQAVGRALITDFGKPAEYVGMAEQHYRAVTKGVELSVEIGNRIAKLPKIDQRAVTAFMTAGGRGKRAKVVEEVARRGGDSKGVHDLATEAMWRDIRIGQELADTGAISERTARQWRGKHIRREYEKYEDPLAYVLRTAQKNPAAAAQAEASLKAQAGIRGRTSPIRAFGKSVSRRKDIPAEIQDEMGVILEAAHPVAHGQSMATTLVATRKFFAQTAERFAKDAPEQGHVLVGTADNLGALKGKYLPLSIAEDINRVVDKPGMGMRLLRNGVGWWKYGKVILSPATHGRNITSNLILADMAGLSVFRPHRIIQAAKSLRKGAKGQTDAYYDEAKEFGSFLTDSFAGAELPDMLNASQDARGLLKGLSKMRGILRKPAAAYQYEEHLFKMAFFIDQRKMGKSAKLAAEAAEEGLFNYRRVPWLIDKLRTTGVVPFVTFTYKAIPATGRALARRPGAVNRYGNIFRTFEHGESPDERKALWPDQRDGWMRLPGKDARGRTTLLNLSYILPLSNPRELLSSGGFLGQGGPSSPLASMPLAQLVSALVTQQDPFTNKDISKQYGGWGKFLKNFILPPVVGGRGSDEIVAALKGAPTNPLSRRAEPQSLTRALLANTVGLRLRDVDFNEERATQIAVLAGDMREIAGDMRIWDRAMANLTEEEYEEHRLEQMDRISEVVRDINALNALQLPPTVAPSSSVNKDWLSKYRVSPPPKDWLSKYRVSPPPSARDNHITR